MHEDSYLNLLRLL